MRYTSIAVLLTILGFVVLVTGCGKRPEIGESAGKRSPAIKRMTIDERRQVTNQLDTLFVQEYHKFRDVVSIRMRQPYTAPNGLDIQVSAYSSGTNPPSGSYVRFSSTSESWKLLKFRDVIFLCDGNRITFDDTKHDGSVLQGGGVLESVTIGLDPAQLKTVAFATNTEIKVGILPEIKLPHNDRAPWRALSQYLEMAND